MRFNLRFRFASPGISGKSPARVGSKPDVPIISYAAELNDLPTAWNIRATLRLPPTSERTVVAWLAWPVRYRLSVVKLGRRGDMPSLALDDIVAERSTGTWGERVRSESSTESRRLRESRLLGDRFV